MSQVAVVLTSLRITSLESASRSINLETPTDGQTIIIIYIDIHYLAGFGTRELKGYGGFLVLQLR